MPTDPDQNIALWEKALVLKLRDTYQTEEDFRKGFEIAVEGYWHRKVVPTKFGTGPWEKPYANLAELAKDVMYQYLRAYIITLGKGFGKTPGFIRGDEPKPFVSVYHIPVRNIYIS